MWNAYRFTEFKSWKGPWRSFRFCSPSSITFVVLQLKIPTPKWLVVTLSSGGQTVIQLTHSPVSLYINLKRAVWISSCYINRKRIWKQWLGIEEPLHHFQNCSGESEKYMLKEHGWHLKNYKATFTILPEGIWDARESEGMLLSYFLHVACILLKNHHAEITTHFCNF